MKYKLIKFTRQNGNSFYRVFMNVESYAPITRAIRKCLRLPTTTECSIDIYGEVYSTIRIDFNTREQALIAIDKHYSIMQREAGELVVKQEIEYIIK